MDKMLKPSRVAKELGVSVNTVDRWIRLKKISAFRLPSGKYQVLESELARIKREGIIERKEARDE